MLTSLEGVAGAGETERTEEDRGENKGEVEGEEGHPEGLASSSLLQ